MRQAADGGDGHEREHGHRHEQAPDHAGQHEHAGQAGHEHRHRPVAAVLGLLRPHRHDPAGSLDDALAADERGIRALQLSLAGLGLTAAIQLAVVLASGSVGLLADTIHNVSDALTAVPLWVAFSLGRRAASRRYTYGFRRAEDLAGLFVLLVIVVSAAVAAWESLQRLVHPQVIGLLPAVAAAGLVGFAGNELVALYRIRVGREIGSAALVADGYHARADGLTSLAVVGGTVGVALGYPLADPLVGLLITLAILLVLRQAAGQMVERLMDAVEPGLVDRVEGIARGVAQVQEVQLIRLRWLGHVLEAEVVIAVDADLTVAAGHAVAEEIRHRLLHEVERLDVVLIHVNPCGHAGDPHALLRHHEEPGRRPAEDGRIVAP